MGCTIVYSLSHDGDLLAGVNSLAQSKEGSVAHTVGVEVTSILVTDTGVSVVAITTLGTSATEEAVCAAGMGSESRGHRVGFPYIHFTAAGTEVSGSRVGVAGRASPTDVVSLCHNIG